MVFFDSLVPSVVLSKELGGWYLLAELMAV